ncbi:hypothetical protein [Fodinibius sp.]|uniref:hypothetical protein n=1 Tax=Fodinibius sp. TaxID=1872440 RepID=UPI002ACE3AF9|nr:hypothetical protein [Fodinibius sp.]MDZ7659355.1 hypothetical protein [Fodinibius sp.]
MPDKLSEILKDDSFVRFLKGSASEEEIEQWTAWMQESAKNAKIAKKAQKLLNKGTQTIPKPDSDLELERLMERIDSENRYKPLQEVKKKHTKMVWATMAAAAGILLLVGFLARHTLLQQNDGTESSRAASINYQLIETKTGQKTTVHYSDGSDIVMNANSQMRVP